MKADATTVMKSFKDSKKEIAPFDAKFEAENKVYVVATNAATKAKRTMEGTEQKDTQTLNDAATKVSAANAAKAKKNGEENFELKKEMIK